ncbi:MAG: hypothetical protein IKF72_07565 [Kiritimatiellae bacterium]|nr:hypothetical protein [Kiritimatiellia bacterium]
MNIKCPHCGTGYDAEESEYGRFVKCAACGKGFVAGTSVAPWSGKSTSTIKNTARIATNTICVKTDSLTQSLLLYESSPWTIRFSTVYTFVFGCALAVCNLLTAKSLSSLVQSLFIFTIAIAIAFALVRYNFVRWLLIVWGGFNAILLFCGSRDFAFLWPFHICFIVIAILLITPSARQWYNIQGRAHNFKANPLSTYRVSACATVLALVMGIFLYAGYSLERKRIIESRNNNYAYRDSDSSSLTLSHTASPPSSHTNAKNAIREALSNVKNRYRLNLTRLGLTESYYDETNGICDLMLLDINSWTKYQIVYYRGSEQLEWPRLMQKDMAELLMHDRMLIDTYEKTSSR